MDPKTVTLDISTRPHAQLLGGTHAPYILSGSKSRSSSQSSSPSWNCVQAPNHRHVHLAQPVLHAAGLRAEDRLTKSCAAQ